MSSETQTQTPSENQIQPINYENVKAFERKYNARQTKEKVVEITYLPKWNLKELIQDAMEYANVMQKVVRILGVYSLGFGRNISITITPKGFVRFSIMLGFRIGLDRPNAIDVTPQDIPVLKLLLEQVEKIVEELQS